MLALLLVAVSLCLSNFAASVGIGISGADARTRLRVGVIFGVFETAMPILGLLAGRSLAATLGRAGRWIGAGLLIATGIYAAIRAIRHPDSQENARPGVGLNAWLGWWWADPAAALVIVAVAVKEGLEAWEIG